MRIVKCCYGLTVSVAGSEGWSVQLNLVNQMSPMTPFGKYSCDSLCLHVHRVSKTIRIGHVFVGELLGMMRRVKINYTVCNYGNLLSYVSRVLGVQRPKREVTFLKIVREATMCN